MPRQQPPDREAAARGGVRSGEVRREKRQVRADLRARTKFEEAAPEMAGVLIDAALGKGIFTKLDAKDRANFAVKVLEYGVGRPRSVEPHVPASEEKHEQDGLSFTVGPLSGSQVVDEPGEPSG